MNKQFAIKVIAACAVLTRAGACFPHVVLEDKAALAGTSYRAVFRVGHGCDGSSTTGLQVILPPGFNGGQPMPKPGWTVVTTVGKLAEPYASHGKTYTDGVLSISWTAKDADSALLADHYDEFILRGTTPAKPGNLWFKVVQTCTQGVNAWVEVPASGNSTKGFKSPAALLEVLDTQTSGDHHH